MTNIDPFFFGQATDTATTLPDSTPATAPTAPADPFDIYVPEQFQATETTTPVAPGANVPQETPAEREARLRRELDERLAAQALARQQEDAFVRLRALLSRIGLDALETNVRGLIARGITDGDAVLFELRETAPYKQRFAANAAREKKGLPALDPATYVQLEESFRTTLRSNGLPSGFYDEPDDFRKLIEGDVSPAELNTRVQQGYRLVADADPEVKRQMQTLYGVNESQLAAYFIDPERATPLLTRQAQAAQISARAFEQGGMQLGVGTVEDLVARGYSIDEAQQAFQRAGQLAGLYTEMAGEEALTQEQKVGAAFGFDVQAQEALQRRQRQRVAEFEAGGQFARTTGATSGAIETGLGGPQ